MRKSKTKKNETLGIKTNKKVLSRKQASKVKEVLLNTIIENL